MATPIAVFYSGKVLTAPYTPGSAVVAGDVIVQGQVPCIALVDIAANAKGALAIDGGIWKMPKAVTSASALSVGARVYWDASAEEVTATAGSNKTFGFVAVAAAAADATVLVAKVLETT